MGESATRCSSHPFIRLLTANYIHQQTQSISRRCARIGSRSQRRSQKSGARCALCVPYGMSLQERQVGSSEWKRSSPRALKWLLNGTSPGAVAETLIHSSATGWVLSGCGPMRTRRGDWRLQSPFPHLITLAAGARRIAQDAFRQLPSPLVTMRGKPAASDIKDVEGKQKGGPDRARPPV